MTRFLVALNRAETLWADRNKEASASQCLFKKKEAEEILNEMRKLFPGAHIVDLMPWYGPDKEE